METEAKKCKKIKAVTGVRVVCDPPSHVGRIYGASYGTPEYWKRLRNAYQDWVDELESFIRDHRSRDTTGLSVETDTQDVCSACGREWEYDEEAKACACCGAEVEA